MKILVICSDCTAREQLFGDDRLTKFRRLMDGGCCGKLESVVPITAERWLQFIAWLQVIAERKPRIYGKLLAPLQVSAMAGEAVSG
jgi:predicted AlkP superfamily phosphohydrolase/phosphomutase